MTHNPRLRNLDNAELYLTASNVTASVAQIDNFTSENVLVNQATIYGRNSLSQTPNQAFIEYSPGDDKLVLFPGAHLSGNLTVQGTISSSGNITTAGDLAVNGGDITSTQATLNINAGGTVRIQDNLTVDGDLAVNGGDITSTQSILNINAGGTVRIQDDLTVQGTISSSGNITTAGDLVVNGGDITSASPILNIDAGGTVNIQDDLTVQGTISSSVGYTGNTYIYGASDENWYDLTFVDNTEYQIFRIDDNAQLQFQPSSNTLKVENISASNITVDISSVIDVSSSLPALRITQRGPGYALRVEDQANPDSTPFIIDQQGRVAINSLPEDQFLRIVGNSSEYTVFHIDFKNISGSVARLAMHKDVTINQTGKLQGLEIDFSNLSFKQNGTPVIGTRTFLPFITSSAINYGSVVDAVGVSITSDSNANFNWRGHGVQPPSIVKTVTSGILDIIGYEYVGTGDIPEFAYPYSTIYPQIQTASKISITGFRASLPTALTNNPTTSTNIGFYCGAGFGTYQEGFEAPKYGFMADGGNTGDDLLYGFVASGCASIFVAGKPRDLEAPGWPSTGGITTVGLVMKTQSTNYPEPHDFKMFAAYSTDKLNFTTNTFRPTVRQFYIGPRQYGATSATSIGTMATVAIHGPTIANTNIAATESCGLLIHSGNVDTGGSVTTAYGVKIEAPLGATNNIAAAFIGRVEISNNNTSPALKITQTGTGNCLVVEDASSDTTPFIIDASGNVGIKTTNTSGYTLRVEGSARITQGVVIDNDTYVALAASAGTTAVYTDLFGRLVDNSSDERVKKNINTIPDALQKVNNLRGVTFEWDNSRIQNFQIAEQLIGVKVVGLIAQEVEAVIPELTYTNSNNLKAVKYAETVALLIEAIKELSTQNEQLKQKNSDFESRLAAIEAKLTNT